MGGLLSAGPDPVLGVGGVAEACGGDLPVDRGGVQPDARGDVGREARAVGGLEVGQVNRPGIDGGSGVSRGGSIDCS